MWFQSLLASAVVKAILEWLKSLWEDLLEAARHREEGRKEVKDALDKQKLEADKALEELRNTSTSFDAAIDELRKRSGSSN